MNKRQRKKNFKNRFVHLKRGKLVSIKFLEIHLPKTVFEPDMIMVDYADIIKPPNGSPFLYMLHTHKVPCKTECPICELLGEESRRVFNPRIHNKKL